MTKAAHINEAMHWSKGALNCFLAAKVDGQAFIGGYVRSQVALVREHLIAARELQNPLLP